ncbi:Gfo/Idh/MocA family protein [Streptomyces fuscigenes]|uniref:Gfo/Idh/MocA family protein n=1 Tax=Streptomyces fuscigenes TaxID=1528880 RepID=UPI001F2D4852|nr:Gfo/Idh/MocA family oxidoreductase [Streptomyces fuscigenes]MCF3960838.1 Gfo/Idh/MocA family oxidoreductase [Streptomyces fuscigenes]
MSSAPLGAGLVGCGAFGAYVLDAVAGLPGLGIRAVADADTHRAAPLGARHGAAVCDGLDALLARADVDVVVIATPPHTHADLAVRALRGGRHVFCEKPLALTAEDARRVGDEARRSGKALAVDHVLRHNPLLRALERLMAEGLLERPRRFLFENDAADEDLGPDHWFWDPARSGGIFVEHGVHFFDAAEALLGAAPATVRATAVRRRGGPVDMVVADVVHESGALATHLHSFTHAHRAERQLMRLDHGFAESVITGWIPTRATVTAWTDDDGAARWERLPLRAAELLDVAGFEPSGDERVTVRVERGAGGSAPASGRGVSRTVPHRVEAVVDLGGEAAKARVYTQSVRAAFADLMHSAATGSAPVAGAAAGISSVAVAEAAARAATSGTERHVAARQGGTP